MKPQQPAYLGIVFGIVVLTGIVVCPLATRQDHVFAQDQETNTIMERIEKIAEATGSYHAEVTTVINEKGKTSVIKGQFKFKWPNLRWEEARYPTRRGFRLGLIISDGQIQWNYSPSRKYAFKYDLKALDEDARQKGWTSADYFEKGSLQYVGREHLEQEEMYVFEGTSSALLERNSPDPPGKTRMYLSVKNGIIRKIVKYDHKGQITLSKTFSNIRKDPSITAKDFEFTPPEGTRIFNVKDVGSRASN